MKKLNNKQRFARLQKYQPLDSIIQDPKVNED